MTESLSTDELVLPTANRILVAVREVVLESGFAALSTRAVADRAGVPLSQIHYHFGSKEQMILRQQACQSSHRIWPQRGRGTGRHCYRPSNGQ